MYQSLSFIIFLCIVKMKNIDSRENVGKSFHSKNFGPCEDLQLCRIHVHILQDPIIGVNQTGTTFLQRSF